MANQGTEKKVQIRSLKNQAVIAEECHVVERYFDRLRGLIGRSGFVRGQGMLFPKCNSIHMWFMGFPIDVVFIRLEKRPGGKVARVVSSAYAGVRPWKLLPLSDWKADETLELPSGAIEAGSLRKGDELCLS